MQHDSLRLGGMTGLLSSLVPDGVLSFAEKVLSGIIIAIVSALVHDLTRRLTERKR